MAISTNLPSLEEIVTQLQDAGIDTDDLELRMNRARTAATSAMQASAVVTAQPAETPRVLAAATRGHFLPTDLGFAAEQASADPELRSLLAQCDVAPMRGRYMWLLKPEVRRQVLQQAKASNSLKAAADKPLDEGDPEGSLLRRALNGFSPDLEALSDDELEKLAIVSDWLTGTDLAQLPPSIAVRRLIAKHELLQPFCALVGRSPKDGSDGSKDRVVGRAKETEALRAYVGIVPAERLRDRAARSVFTLWHSVTRSEVANEPLVINGIGGMGKSTLVAKFILDHALFPGADLPFAYLDFDRAALAPREPLQLLIDIALQLSVRFPAIEAPLAKLRADLRSSIDLLASNPSERSREDMTRSRLHACCFELKSIVESMNQGRAPVLLVFDTFEVAQYDDNAVKSVADLISALRAPARGDADTPEPWSNLRIVVTGRAAAEEIKTTKTPIFVGPLTPSETEELIRRRNEIDALDLTKPQIKALAKPLSNSPLDVTIVMNWLNSRKPTERAALTEEIVRQVSSDETDLDRPKEESLAYRRITGVLINRMVKHINDPAVQKLAIPGLVVRVVTPDVIRNVMAPASGLVAAPQDLSAGAADELFRRLEQERWLVTRSGNAVRHRPEVRLAMLDLMRRQDRQRFEDTNQLAIDYFRRRATLDDESRAETIYHLLLAGDFNIEEAEWLWKSTVGVFLQNAVDELSGLAQVYLKAKLGRSVPIRALQTLPASATFSVLVSFGQRFIQRGLSEGLSSIIDEVRRVERKPELLGLYWETLYRSGRWRDLRHSVKSDMSSGTLAEVIAALRENDFRAARAADNAAGRPLRFALRLATRDPQTADAVFAQGLHASKVDLERVANFGEAYWDFAAFIAHATRRLTNFSNEAGRDRLIASIGGEISGSDRKLPAAATASGALRVLAFYETDPARPILRRLDFESYFSTVSSRELQLLRETFVAISDRLRSARGMADVVARGERLVKMELAYPTDSVIADLSTTQDFAIAARGLAELGDPHASVGVLRLLAMTHPDWLESMGHALTRAFKGEVPNDLGWWSSIKSSFGASRPRRRPTNGHAILSMADEAGILAESVQTYEKRLDREAGEARDFFEIAQAFRDWRAALDAAIQGTAALGL